MQAQVRNSGNQVLGSFTVRDTVIHSTSLVAMTSGSAVVPAGLAAQATALVTFPNSFTPTTAGTYQLNTSIAGITGDMVASNDRKTQEIIVIDTALTTMTLDYSNGVAGGGGLSWTGGNGGIAIYVEPPVYPVRISGSRFLITSNTTSVGFYAKIYRDNGPNKSPGTLLDSVYVSPMQITTGIYTAVTTANSNIYIDSGGVYLAWIMAGTDINIGRDNTQPISYRTYEVLFNSWADYRDKFIEDFCIGIDVVRPAPMADFNIDASSDPAFTFTDITAYSPTTWSWNFGDGGTSNLQNPTHTYTSTGQKNVCLTAGNTYGTNQKCKLITVSNGAPVAMFTYDATNMPIVDFTDASGGAPTAWKWDFDDIGQDSSNLQNPTYIFNTNGNHNVCLTVSNQYGTSPAYCQVVTITGIGIDESGLSANAMVFPNPAHNRLFIVTKSDLTAYSAKLRVFDVTGREIPLNYTINKNALEVSCGNIGAGIYMFTVTNGNNVLSKGRFTVQ